MTVEALKIQDKTWMDEIAGQDIAGQVNDGQKSQSINQSINQ